MMAIQESTDDRPIPRLLKMPEDGLGIGRYDERQTRAHPACFVKQTCEICGDVYYTKLKSRIFHTCSHECSLIYLDRKYQKAGGKA
ncbi:MAG TPA: hypothetical protein VKM55_30820 [Candidatus Lokiarchaeia archaeon]|nr:hypothetical protein [Candidatus Lokiarchaeia archaeon]